MNGTDEMERSILELAAVLAAETASLKAHNLVGVSALASRKRAAVDAFLSARAALTSEELQPVATELAVATDSLREGVRENRALLEEAIAVQGHVLRTLAGAAKRVTPASGPYGRGSEVASPLALSVRA